MANKVFVEGQWKDEDEVQNNSAADEIHSHTLTRLITAAPLAIGAGIGARNIFKAKLNIFNKKDEFNKNGASLSKFLNQVKTPSFENNTVLIQDILGRKGALDPKLVQTAWTLATQHGDPGNMLRHPTLDSNNPLASIEYFAQHNKSLQANKVIREFSRQMRVLEKHVSVTGSLPQIQTIAPTIPVIKSVGFDSFAHRPGLMSELQKIESQLPAGISMNMKLAADRFNGGEGMLMVSFRGGKFGAGATLELPIASSRNQGIVYSGVSQLTQRAVGQYALVDPTTYRIKSTLNHEEYAARRFREQVLTEVMGSQRMTERVASQMVNNFNREMLEPSQVLANIPEGLIPSHDASVTLAGNRINLVFENSLDRLNGTGVGNVIRNTDQPFQVFPSTSPQQLASGVVSRVDASSFWVGGYAYGRRPMQAFGRSIGPTMAANQARLGNSLYKQYDWMHTEQLEKFLPFSGRPELMARTVYVSETRVADKSIVDRALGGQAGGAGLISDRLKSELEYEMPLSKNLASVTDKVKTAIANDTLNSTTFTEGEILGWEQGGKAVVYNKNWQLDKGTGFTRKGDNFYNISGVETIRDEQYMKMFGSAKFVGRVTDRDYMERLVARTTGVTGLGDIGVVVGMDELRKNRSLHNMQMFTALQEFMSQRATGFTTNRKNWTAAATAALNSATDPNQVVSAAWKIARQQELTPWEIGRVFGAAPGVLGDKWDQLLPGVTDAERTEINKGVAYGVGSYYYAGKANAGGIGSVEPRFFEMLRGSQYGELGSAMAEDITERMVLANPELVHEQNTLFTALRSLDHGAKPMDGVSNYYIGDLRPSDINSIIEHGGIVNLDRTIGDMKNVYIPGMDKSQSMRGYTTPKGIEVTGELSDAYRDLLESAQRIHGGANRSIGEVADANLTARLGEAISATATGDGYGLARGAVMGSRYLTAVSGGAADTGSLFTMGVNKHDVLDMFQEMEETYVGNSEELAALEARKAAFLRGEEIGAIGLRHPLIGPYSAQPLKMRMVKGLTAGNVMVPTESLSISGNVGGEHFTSHVAWGAFPGMAGDYDADTMGLILSSSKIEKDINGYHVSTNPYLNDYKAYAIRQQLLKAKAAQSPGLTFNEAMAAAAEKQSTAKEMVGPLSEPIRELRTQVIESGNLKGQRLTNALSLLEALEQNPISGKHLPDTEIASFRKEIEDISTSARAGNGNALANIAEKLFSGNPKARQLLTEDMEVTLGDGSKFNIPGMGIDQVAADITQSKIRHEDMMLPGEANARRTFKGSSSLRPEDRTTFGQYSGGPLSAFKIVSEGGRGQTIARKTTAVMNEIRAAGGEILEHAGKPLALGFGASLALSSILSSPKSNLEPGSSAPPPPGERIASPNADGVAPETMFPDREVQGEPTVSPPIPPKTVRLSDQRGSYKIRVSGKTRPGTNLGDVSGQINGNLEGTTTTTVNVRDNRKSLSAQYIDSIMRR